MQKYYINSTTLWLENTPDSIFIQEINITRKLDLNLKLEKLIDDSCLYYGCSYIGRKKGSEELIGKHYKIPIVVKDSGCLIIFPMFSRRNNKNIWFVFNNIKNYNQINKNEILIEFTGGLKKKFYLSYYIFYQQILTSSILKVTYLNRNN